MGGDNRGRRRGLVAVYVFGATALSAQSACDAGQGGIARGGMTRRVGVAVGEGEVGGFGVVCRPVARVPPSEGGEMLGLIAI